MSAVFRLLTTISVITAVVLFIATLYGCTNAPTTVPVQKTEPAPIQQETVQDVYPFENDDFVDENNTVDIGTIL